jgi:hypothetical protein
MICIDTEWTTQPYMARHSVFASVVRENKPHDSRPIGGYGQHVFAAKSLVTAW